MVSFMIPDWYRKTPLLDLRKDGLSQHIPWFVPWLVSLVLGVRCSCVFAMISHCVRLVLCHVLVGWVGDCVWWFGWARAPQTIYTTNAQHNTRQTHKENPYTNTHEDNMRLQGGIQTHLTSPQLLPNPNHKSTILTHPTSTWHSTSQTHKEKQYKHTWSPHTHTNLSNTFV